MWRLQNPLCTSPNTWTMAPSLAGKVCLFLLAEEMGENLEKPYHMTANTCSFFSFFLYLWDSSEKKSKNISVSSMF